MLEIASMVTTRARQGRTLEAGSSGPTPSITGRSGGTSGAWWGSPTQTREVPGDTQRNLVVHASYSGLTFKQILAPLWLVAYTYKGSRIRWW